MLSPFDKPQGRKVVEQCDKPTWVHAENLTHRLLGEARVASQHAKQARVLRLQVDGRESSFEQVGGMEAGLRKQKGNTDLRHGS